MSCRAAVVQRDLILVLFPNQQQRLLLRFLTSAAAAEKIPGHQAAKYINPSSPGGLEVLKPSPILRPPNKAFFKFTEPLIQPISAK